MHTSTKKIVSPRYTSSSKHLSTHYCNAAIIALNQPSPVSSLITTNQVDTDVKNYDHSKSFLTPRKHNHSTPEIHYTNTTSTQVQPNVHPCLCPYIPSNPTTPLKLPTYIKELICFKIGNENDHTAQFHK